jgi:hypothetical protein
MRGIKTHQSYNRKDAMKTVSLVHTERRASSPAWTIVAVILLALLAACSEDKPTEPVKPEVKGPELVTARTALQKVYVAARGWNQDARPYRLESSLTSDGNGHDGKSAVWRQLRFCQPAFGKIVYMVG